MSVLSLFAGAVTVLLHGTLIDGTGAAPEADAFIEIRNGRIAASGRASEYEPESGVQILDATGRWIVPGLIDTHVHFLDSGSLYTSPDDYDLRAFVPHEEERRRIRARIPSTLEAYLCSGVTTVASLGGPAWELALAGETKAPSVLVAGPFLAGFPVGELSLWTAQDPVLEPLISLEEGRARVGELASQGVDLVKVGWADVPGNTFDDFEPTLRGVVDEAHGFGLRVVMHAEELWAAKRSVRAGVDVLAHTVSDRRIDEEFIRLVKRHGVFVITGLSHFDRYRRVLAGEVELLPIEEKCGDPRVIATWSDLSDIPAAKRPPVPPAIQWGSSSEGQSILLDNIRRMHEAGIPIAVGSNAGNIGTLHGPSFHRELRMLVRAGLSPDAVLVAATRNGTRALGMAEERGTLEPGKRADLIVLSADPLADVDNLAAVESVFVGGKLVHGQHEAKRQAP